MQYLLTACPAFSHHEGQPGYLISSLNHPSSDAYSSARVMQPDRGYLICAWNQRVCYTDEGSGIQVSLISAFVMGDNTGT